MNAFLGKQLISNGRFLPEGVVAIGISVQLIYNPLLLRCNLPQLLQFYELALLSPSFTYVVAFAALTLLTAFSCYLLQKISQSIRLIFETSQIFL